MHVAQIMLQPLHNTDIDKATGLTDCVSTLCHDERDRGIPDNSGPIFQKVGQILVVRHDDNVAAGPGSALFLQNLRPLLSTRPGTARCCLASLTRTSNISVSVGVKLSKSGCNSLQWGWRVTIYQIRVHARRPIG